MRPLKTAAISFGMVTIPVKLYTATEQKDVRFRLLHKTDHAPIVEKRFCTVEDVEVGWDDLVRGFEVSKGQYVVVDPEEIEAAGPETADTIDIGDFVELQEIDPIYFEKSYYLEPLEMGAKPFNLLRRALEETGRIALARVTIRTKERLATLRVYGGTLVLETMYWPDEIRSTQELAIPDAGRAAPSGRELQMARSLVDSLSSKFRPDQYQDRYRIALQELIERKMSGEQRNAKRRRPEPKVIDLMAALEASLASARERGGRAASPPAETAAGKTATAAGKAAGGSPAPSAVSAAAKPARRRKKAAA